MKLSMFVVALVLSVQALPATPQIYPPAAADAAAIRVGSGEDLQSALDRAKPGEVIDLPPGATFTGNFVLPAKAGTRYITIRTAPASGQPRAGDRITAAYAGKLAIIRSPNGSAALRTAPGAHHWRLMLLEFAPSASAGGDIIQLGDGSSAQSSADQVPHDLIVDRCFIHGHPERGQKRGIALNSGATTIIGSHISDIKAAGQDAQAIAGWNGPGPFRIENNYLEASGENFLLGGAAPAIRGLVPSDVVFSRNHVTRPVEWREERWTVKNLFELKNARRVLVEGNLFEHNWRSAQPGYAVVLTPSGQRNAAPWTTIEDVTFRFNIVRKVAAVFNLLGRDDTGDSELMRRIRISDNLVYGVDHREWGGNGLFLQIGEGPAELVVEHNTVVNSGNVITVYGGTRSNPATVDQFVFRHNLMLHNANGVIGQGLGVGMPTLAAYFPGATFVRNVLAGGRESRYPSNNFFPDVERFSGQFLDYEQGDLRLRPESEFRRQAEGGRDLGVDFVGLAKTIGVRAREWLGISGAQ